MPVILTHTPMRAPYHKNRFSMSIQTTKKDLLRKIIIYVIIDIKKGTIMSHVDILKLHSLKATPQRLSVLDVLCSHGHATLESIEKETRVKFPTLSLSTIYRNINEMLKKGILSEVKIANKKEYYELTKEDHTHLVCSSCGNIEDFMLSTDEFMKKAQSSTDCKIQKATISFEVVCKECLESLSIK